MRVRSKVRSSGLCVLRTLANYKIYVEVSVDVLLNLKLEDEVAAPGGLFDEVDEDNAVAKGVFL